MFRTYFDEQNKLWYGKNEPPVYNPKASIGQIVLEALQRNPRKIGQISAKTKVSLTNEQIRLKTISGAQNLCAAGYQLLDVVGIFARNVDHLAPIVFACLTLGLPVHPISPDSTKDEIIYLYNVTKPAIILCEMDNLPILIESVKELTEKVQIYVFTNGMDELPEGVKSADELLVATGNESYFVPPTLKDIANHPALIQCSSGTTGFPKAVSISHPGYMTQSGVNLNQAEDVTFSYSPLFWISGTIFLINGTIAGATRIITTDTFSAERLLKTVEEYKISFLFTPPSSLAQLATYPSLNKKSLSTIRIFGCGGSTVHEEHVQRISDMLQNGKMCIGYGLTELSGISHNTYGHDQPALNTVGQTSDRSWVKIVDANGQRLGIGERGEICTKRIYNFLGYVGNEEATKEMFDEEGFLKTGDIGMYDEAGNLQIVDRIKDIIKYNNVHVSPSELENIIATHPAVRQVVVCGIPDVVHTDLPSALIVPKPNTTVNVDEIIELVKSKVSDQKQLRGGVYLVDSLPLSNVGKVRRFDAKELAIKLHMEKLAKQIV